MRNKLIIQSILFLMMGCEAENVNHSKDLNQNMMDLRIYQENLGDQIKAKNLKEASWLLEGMDSILLILNQQFPEHRRLDAPFSYYYKKELQQPLKGIRKAIREQDTAKALQNYRILIDNCNDCHIDNEVDKEVKF